MREAFIPLRIGYGMALLGIFIVIATIFRSYAQPFVIMFTVPFGIIGMLVHRKRYKENVVLSIAIAAFSLSLVFFFVTTRYRILYVPFMAVFAASGIYALWEAAHNNNLRRVAGIIGGVIAVFFLLNMKLPADTPARRTERSVSFVQQHVDEALGYIELKEKDKALATVLNRAKLALDQNGNIYISKVNPYSIIKYSQDGTPLLNFMREFDMPINPVTIYRDNEGNLTHVLRQEVCYDLRTGDDGLIYNLVKIKGYKGGKTIDVYAATGDYLLSYYLKNRAKAFALRSEHTESV